MNQKIRITAHALAESSFLWDISDRMLTLLHFHFSLGRCVFCNLSCNPFSLPFRPSFTSQFGWATLLHFRCSMILFSRILLRCTFEKSFRHIIGKKEKPTHDEQNLPENAKCVDRPLDAFSSPLTCASKYTLLSLSVSI